jgi:peptidoglycan/LPS O-acetylase OafA/YrhL
VIAFLLALSVLAGWLLYRLVETPFMVLRERYFPSNSPRQAVVAGNINPATTES